MRIGMMDRRIVIEQDVANQNEPNEHGEVIPDWQTLATVWAYRKPMKGSEKPQSQQELAQAEYMFRIRYRDDLTPKMRIREGAVIHDIIFIPEVGRKKATEIFTKVNVS